MINFDIGFPRFKLGDIAFVKERNIDDVKLPVGMAGVITEILFDDFEKTWQFRLGRDLTSSGEKVFFPDMALGQISDKVDDECLDLRLATIRAEPNLRAPSKDSYEDFLRRVDLRAQLGDPDVEFFMLAVSRAIATPHNMGIWLHRNGFSRVRAGPSKEEFEHWSPDSLRQHIQSRDIGVIGERKGRVYALVFRGVMHPRDRVMVPEFRSVSRFDILGDLEKQLFESLYSLEEISPLLT